MGVTLVIASTVANTCSHLGVRADWYTMSVTVGSSWARRTRMGSRCLLCSAAGWFPFDSG